MKKIRVNLNDRSYDIMIGSGVIKTLPGIIKKMGFTGPIVVVTDKVVAAKTSKITAPVFKKITGSVHRVIVPSSERSKSIKVYQDVIREISDKTKSHKPLVIAIGGGVVGDLAGFVASTYRRGVPFIQIPTTLLAQVDSSIGGKVGIDLPQAKNLAGAFYQPKCVIMDTDFLATLPKRQVRNGMGEVIKYGIIAKKSLFTYLDKNMKSILALKKKNLEKVIHDCASIKARVVEKDEFDVKDIRIDLNFGHTLGHAVETASGYSNKYNHGECIAIGMILASEIAVKLDMLKKKDLTAIADLIRKAGLPGEIKGLPIKDIMVSQGYDKKFVAGSNRFVLPVRIGKVEVVEGIPPLLIKTVLREYVSK